MSLHLTTLPQRAHVRDHVVDVGIKRQVRQILPVIRDRRRQPKFHFAFVGLAFAQQRFDQRAFTSAVCTQQGDDIATLENE